MHEHTWNCAGNNHKIPEARFIFKFFKLATYIDYIQYILLLYLLSTLSICSAESCKDYKNIAIESCVQTFN